MLWRPQYLLEAMQVLSSSGSCRTLHFSAIGDAAVKQAVKSCDQILCATSLSYEFGSKCASEDLCGVFFVYSKLILEQV
jgi:hypothetical protein